MQTSIIFWYHVEIVGINFLGEDSTSVFGIHQFVESKGLIKEETHYLYLVEFILIGVLVWQSIVV